MLSTVLCAAWHITTVWDQISDLSRVARSSSSRMVGHTMNSRLFVEVEPKQRFPTPLLRIFEQQPNRFGFQPKGWVMLPSRPRVLATVYKTNRISPFPDWLASLQYRGGPFEPKYGMNP
jgi:hypothetical protein